MDKLSRAEQDAIAQYEDGLITCEEAVDLVILAQDRAYKKESCNK